jgi:Ni,Fe-hydrogenase I small subunit
MDNPEKLGTQDEEKHNTTQHNTTCIGCDNTGYTDKQTYVLLF